MIHYGYIPPNDKLNIRLFGLLRMYLDETQYIHLIPYPLLDGTSDHTLPKGKKHALKKYDPFVQNTSCFCTV